MTKQITLTKGLFTLVDDEDYEVLNQWKWHSHMSTDKINHYARRTYRSNGKMAPVYMHRVVMNCPEDLQVDHKDHNGLNNQKGNLRLCSGSQNSVYKKKMPNCTSRFKGVFWDKAKKMWCGRLQCENRIVLRKRFKTELEAAKAYNEAALKYHGEFAILNNLEAA